MAFRRERVMFRVDASAPDPDILRLRFRRRVLFLSLLGALLLLAVPVLRDRLPALQADIQARLLAQRLLDMRLNAQTTRSSQAMSFDPKDEAWKHESFAGEDSLCQKEHLPGPNQILFTNDFSWRAVVRKKDGSDAKDAQRICYSSFKGLSVDGNALNDDQEVLLVVGPKSDRESARADRLRNVVVDAHGDSVQLGSFQN